MTEHNASRRGRAQVVARWGRRRAASDNGRRPSSMGWLESAAVVALARLVGSACALSLLAPPASALTHRRGEPRVTGPAAGPGPRCTACAARSRPSGSSCSKFAACRRTDLMTIMVA
jgi:hypothetical protein